MSDPLSLTTIYSRLWQAFSFNPAPEVEFTQPGALRSCFAVTDFASASIAVVGGLLAQLSGTSSLIRVDRRLASYWFHHSLYPVNRPPQSLWDPLAGDYPTQEGWIRLHTNAAHHRRAMAHVLGEHDSRASLASAVRQWQAEAL